MTRAASETRITVGVNPTVAGAPSPRVGVLFHMLSRFRHGNIDLTVLAEGDLHVDEHHTIEDVGIALGEAFNQALGSKKGVERYGFLLPMDDCLAQVAIDFGGRPWLVWNVTFLREFIGDMPTEMCMHFFKCSATTHAVTSIYRSPGRNEHHKMERSSPSPSHRMAVKRSHPEHARRGYYNELLITIANC